MKRKGDTNGNGARTATARQRTTGNVNGALEPEARLWWLIVARGPDLELRRRKGSGQFRMRCPLDDSHEVTFANGTPGIALTCHGPVGADSPGHSLATHNRQRDGAPWDIRYPDLDQIPFPCRWCGCAESQVLAALGARPRDKFRQAEAQRGRCSCRASGYRVGELPVLCLEHLIQRVGLADGVLS